MGKQIIIRPVITEKSSTSLGNENKYVFEVLKSANKIEIRKAVESVFGVKVTSVNTLNVRAKEKRLGRFIGKSSAWKKAVVSLKDGDKIDGFEKLV